MTGSGHEIKIHFLQYIFTTRLLARFHYVLSGFFRSKWDFSGQNEFLPTQHRLVQNAKWSVSQITSRIRQTFGRGRWTPQKARQGKDAAMPGPRPALCTFPDDFLQEAIDTVGRRTVAVQTVQRFRLVLLLHERPSLGNDEAAAAVGLSARQVQRWRSRWATGDFSVEDHPGRGRKAAFSPSGSSVDPSDGL